MTRCLKEEIKAYLSKGKTERAEEYRQLAEKWIFDDEYEKNGEFTCRRCCEVLGQDIVALRLNVMYAKSNNMTLTQFINYRLKKGSTDGHEESNGGHRRGEGTEEQEKF